MTDAILWAIFVLLFLALVLQVIVARRGPWGKSQQPNRAPMPSRHVRLIGVNGPGGTKTPTYIGGQRGETA